eukprot:TRINITY_DN14424_c0_g1_i1.p1 TRINITY_DN14424_c0_g1~~TRINITY_DN14424_c0_g1_i1.p1  ORF type:complete len:293 (-),score=-4.78 TRINITY_DN14424_c0_g1_i1:297-1175(-)
MKHSIQNEYLKISVLKKGAELCSIQSLTSGKELMWQADPSVWGSHAPNLFPVIGCLKDDGFIHEGKEYAMTKHGFVRNNGDVKLLEKTDDQLSFVLRSNESTRKIYPFEFEFRIHFKLEGNKIAVIHEVVNTDNKEMLFCLGGHPAFACQLNEGEAYSDYYLEFEQEEYLNTWNLAEGGLIKEEGECVLDHSNTLDLHPEIFNNDALIFKNLKSSSVSLKCRKSSYELKVSFADFPYLGLWAKPHAPYVCIEPWIGIADVANTNRELHTKEMIQSLPKGETFTASYEIEVKE